MIKPEINEIRHKYILFLITPPIFSNIYPGIYDAKNKT